MLPASANAASTVTLAKFACAYSGLVWGVFWIPLRVLDAVGITGLWATLIFYGLPFLMVLPVLAWRWRETAQGGAYLQATGLMAALGLVLYSVSVLYTDVVRAMLLFYLTPVWSTLLARIFLKEAITPVRLLGIGLGLAGMLVIFKLDMGFPWPEQPGDWLALASGILWAVTASMLRAKQTSAALEVWTQNFLWSGVVALAFILVFPPALDSAPSLDLVVGQLWWLVPTIVIVVMSGVYAALWGASKLSPGLVGLLFMTEISVGAITAAIWSGEPFGWREAIGVTLITGAALMESLWSLRSETPRPAGAKSA